MAKKLIFTSLLVFTLFACSQKNTENATLYFNGDIITMEGAEPQYVEAVLVKEGKIAFVGTLAEAEKLAKNTKKIDLAGKTLLPGFIDAHSHINMVVNAMGQADLSSPPIGTCKTVSDILETLKKFKEENNIKDGEWLFGWGYDENQLEEKRHLNKFDLDKYFPNNPVYIQHTSGHLGVANSLAMQNAKIDAQSKDPEGGMIERLPNSTEPSGLMMEFAINYFAEKIINEFAGKKDLLFSKAQNLYAKHGITTAQEGMTDMHTIEFLKKAAQNGELIIDVIALPSFGDMDKNLKDTSLHFGKYQNGVKFQGTKIIADGSPQGKTAFFSKPYLTEVPGCGHNCTGFPNLNQDYLNHFFVLGYKNNNQMHVHSNGDATMDMIIAAHEFACKQLVQPLDADRRTVVVHSQFVRPDQLQKFKEYKIIPSFFTNHAYYWGDIHVKNLGEQRAFFLSPIHTADSLGIIYTNHTDCTVTPIDQIFTLWTAVNRVSRTGKVIGPNERATPYQALKAITLNAAYQHFDEALKGSIKEGKLADFVILDKNPLKIDPMEIKNIQVVETIKEGKTIYK